MVSGGRISVNTKILTDLCNQYPYYIYDIYELYCRKSDNCLDVVVYRVAYTTQPWAERWSDLIREETNSSTWIHILLKKAHWTTRNILIVILKVLHILYKNLCIMEMKTKQYDWIMCSED